MIETNSISIFKQKVNLFVPVFVNETDDFFKKLLWSIFKNEYEISSYKLLVDSIEKNGDTLAVFFNEFVESLAELVFKKSIQKDEFIQFLIDSNNSIFEKHLFFLEEVSIAISNIERNIQKEILQNLEIGIEEKEIENAITKLERKEKKLALQEIEKNYGLDSIQTTRITEANENKTNFQFILRIAALFILVLIPLGISIFFYKHSDDGLNSHQNKDVKNLLYSETGDLTELKKIDVPSAIFSNGSIIIENNEIGFGYAKNEEKIKVTIVSYSNQLAYFENKTKQLEEKYSQLKNKRIKAKASTLKSLKDLLILCESKKDELLSLELTYEFKNEKLKLYKQEKIDLKSIKVYSLTNDEEIKSYYLLLDDKYYYLPSSKGKLVRVVDIELLEKLEEI
jgi:hypothetical protein